MSKKNESNVAVKEVSRIDSKDSKETNESKESLKAKLEALKANLEDIDNLEESDLIDLKRLMKSTLKDVKVKSSHSVYLRAQAIAEVIKDNPDISYDDLIIQANERYMKATGKESNIKRTRSIALHVLTTLKVFGIRK